MAATATETAPTPSVSRDPALVSALAARNDTFTTLLSLIPQQYYVQPTQEEADSRWMKNKKRKTGEEIKEHKRKVKQEKVRARPMKHLNGVQLFWHCVTIS